MKRNKITILASNDIATDQRMLRICTSLCKSNFEVEIVGRKLKNSFELDKKVYFQTRLKLFFNRGVLFYLELNIRFILYLFKVKPDIVYSVDADTAIAAIAYKKICKKKLIFDAHELFSEVPELEAKDLKKRIWKIVEKLVILNSELRITVSASIAKYYESLYKMKFDVIRNFPIKIANNENIDYSETDKYILYQGALNKGRCIEQLLKISAHTQIKVKIAGEGDLSNELRIFAQKLKLNVDEIFLGKLKPEDLQKITRKAWLGFNMLENNSLSYYYSLSNKTFDYILAEIPQLMSDFPEYEAINNQFGFGITMQPKEEKMIEVLSNLNENQNLYLSLKNNTKQISELFTWETEETELIKIVKNLFKNI
ncbi:MAG: glycosyltransferase [Bacteroidia bacterium]|nr:glycosyltransferase [Bacteroidia bacterium]